MLQLHPIDRPGGTTQLASLCFLTGADSISPKVSESVQKIIFVQKFKIITSCARWNNANAAFMIFEAQTQ